MLIPNLEQLVLHRCPAAPGWAMVEVIPAGACPSCACGAPVLPDQTARAGHLWTLCPYCQVSIGLCGAESWLALEAEARAVLAR